MIPRLISQTWRTRDLPDPARRLSERWRALHPDFAWRLFDDAEAEAVVAAVAPDALADYRAMPFPVMRADLFRYAVMVRDGGLYLDIDMECLKPVGPLLKGREAVLSVEARLGRRRQRELGYVRGVQVANCVFAAAPGHPFFRAALAEGLRLFRADPRLDRARVEDVTGPRMLTRLFFSRPFAGLTLLRQIHLMAPTLYPDRWPLNRHIHARHRCFGTWKDRGRFPSLHRRWVERNRPPNPFAAGPLALPPAVPHG